MDFSLDAYDRSGIPITDKEWVKLLAIPAYKVVEQTVMMDVSDPTKGFDVSTVWLGLDHRFNRTEGLPIIFETMVFPIGGAETDSIYDEGANNGELACSRYSLESEAKQGHAEYVIEYSLKLTDPVIMDRTPINPEGSQ